MLFTKNLDKPFEQIAKELRRENIILFAETLRLEKQVEELEKRIKELEEKHD